MTLNEIFTVAGILGGLALGLFNYFDKRRNTRQAELTSTGDYLLDANQAVEIANKRALDAERERRESEVFHKKEMTELKEELLDLQERLQKVEKALAYEIRLVAHLGDDPRVEAVSIKRLQPSDVEISK